MKKLTNAAAEQQVLGTCIRYPELLPTVVDKLSATDFSDPRAGMIFSALCRVALSGRTGSIALVEDLRASGELDVCGGDKAITYLESKARKAPEAIQEATDVLVALSKKRDQLAAAVRVADAIQNGQDPSSDLERLNVGPEGPVSWAPLGDVLDSIVAGTHRKLVPTLMRRADGECLLYQNRLNALYGPPEAMKSWAAKGTLVELAEAGLPSIYLDFEEPEPTSFMERICSIALGRGHNTETIRRWVTGAEGVEPLIYYRSAPTGMDTTARAQVLRLVKARQVPFAVLDGVAAAMGSHQPALDEDRAQDVSMWLSAYVWPLVAAGAGVLVIDHTVKNSQNQSSFGARAARGSGHKLAAISGSALMAEVRQAGSAWTRGEVALWQVKDRPGRVKVSTRSGKRLAAVLVSTPQQADIVEVTKLELLSPEAAQEQAAEKAWHLIAAEQICDVLDKAGKTISKGDVKELLDERRRDRGGRGWKGETVARAFAFLTDYGWVAVEKDGRFEMLALVKHYRADLGLIHADEAKTVPVGGDPF